MEVFGYIEFIFCFFGCSNVGEVFMECFEAITEFFCLVFQVFDADEF